MNKITIRRFIFSITAAAAAFLAPARIVPTPESVLTSPGTLRLPEKLTASVSDSTLLPAVEFLATALQTPVQLVDEGLIHFSTAPADSMAYRLRVSPDSITVSSRNREGAINAVATLWQLMPAGGKAPREIECVEIADRPSYLWRGMMLDCVRHFYSVEEIERVLDLMALYKLNVFHWHLVDDQAWRPEIKRYPQLTGKGTFNPLNHLDRLCQDLERRQENPDFALPEKFLKVTAEGDTLYGGFYTQDDMRHIVDYASRRGIDVMPEIDVPGHSWMLTCIMPDVSCGDGAPSGVMCPGKDKSVEVISNVIEELLPIFPFKYFHIGGDEVTKDRWHSCPDCLKRVEEEQLEDVNTLQGWFIRRIELLLRNHGRTLIGWDEIAGDGLSSETAIMWWRGDNWRVLGKATADGKRVVCTSTDCLYINAENNDRFIPLILALDPRGMDLTPSQSRLVQGLQANLWGEVVPSLRRAEYQMFPRLIAVAEAAWTPAGKRLTPDTFWESLPSQYALLDDFGVTYSLPQIQGVDDENVFVGSTTMAPFDMIGSRLRYTTDGSIPTNKSKLLRKPLEIKSEGTYGIASFRPDGTRGNYRIVHYTPTEYVEAIGDADPKEEGLSVAWHLNDKVRACADIAGKPLLKILTANEIALPREVDRNRALVFTGYAYVPADGIYNIHITSDDGSTMTLDGKMVIDNDGYHGSERKQLQMALRQGWHSIEINYFDLDDGSGTLLGGIDCISDPELKVKFAH